MSNFRKTRILRAIFWNKVCAKISTQKSKQVDQKMGYQPQKVQEKKNSKNGAKTAQRPLFKELWAILVKLENNDS